jgi:signal transduction histidine kinase
MEAMLDGLVALSRTSRFSVMRAPVDLAALARELAEECQLSVDRPVEFVCPASIEAQGEATLIRQVLQNLIENAFKFSGTSAVPRVEVGVQPGTPSVYFVRDNGIGFDDTAADNLFEIFHRLSAGDEFPGTGVGLSIAQRAVHKHSGRIWARSQPQAGATFYFTLGPATPTRNR